MIGSGLRRLRPSPALVVAFLALIVAVSGTSYAVSRLPAKSVGAKQLKNNAVTSAKVKDASLRAADFRPGELPAGPAGPQGAVGPPGPTGVSQAGGAWASRNPAYRIPVTAEPSQFVEMFSLTQYADRATGRLRLRGPARLVLSGNVTFVRVDTAAVVRCRFEVKRASDWVQAGPVHTYSSYSDTAVFSLPLTAVVDADTSTEDVRIACRPENDTTEVSFSQGSFSVVVADL